MTSTRLIGWAGGVLLQEVHGSLPGVSGVLLPIDLRACQIEPVIFRLMVGDIVNRR
jgi:hypothetical protein